MSLLVVGLNHRTAPTSLLEQASVSGDDTPKVLHDLAAAAHVTEAVVLSTCNRTEIYADVETFHGGVADISDQLSRICGIDLGDLAGHLYVHHDARAVGHLFSVVCGLDSMLVGESQILGQVRGAFRAGQSAGVAGSALSGLFQAALRVGKRAHSETSIDAAGASIVAVGIRLAASSLGILSEVPAVPVAPPGGSAGELGGAAMLAAPVAEPPPLAGARVLLIGAGAVGSLAAQTARRAGAAEIVIANRTPARAARVAEMHDGRAVGLADLPHEILMADLVISSTGATGLVVEHDLVAATLPGRGGRPLVFLDLALPHDIDPGVRVLPGVSLIDLETLRVALDGAQVAHDVEAVRALVSTEVAGFLDRRRAGRVAPTVVALRAHADSVVHGELARLHSRLPDLDDREWELVEGAVRRVVDKLLHAPTVRVQQLAGAPGGDSYAEALRELFDLPREVPAVVSAPDLDLVERS
ncbi:glutamyl-tRNA reductase [Frankia torreyi]|uniref:Glutamyl-tRNA reductase n=1 Tax=Frankia torreyi TaxID=1856 RepID=A0A0D8BGP6_9ACTN|nr:MULTISPECIES: glutamyl-tRNA reductase [Frankia]KJE23215.1 glutamyl-tRNA reductase [Frankia torreyi]KQC39484.1 glutamyl-tRNA reductase [Frankia sp. ACN1ag]